MVDTTPQTSYPPVEWTITNMDRHLPDGDVCPDGAVYALYWDAHCSHEGVFGRVYGSQNLGEPDPASFTPYSQLTPETALAWLYAGLGEEGVKQVEDSIYAQIENQLHPKNSSGLPW